MSLPSPDGFTLKGTLTLPAAKGKVPVVILAHQFHADRTGWGPLVERLQARGIGMRVEVLFGAVDANVGIPLFRAQRGDACGDRG